MIKRLRVFLDDPFVSDEISQAVKYVKALFTFFIDAFYHAVSGVIYILFYNLF